MTADNFLLWAQLMGIAIWPLEYWFTTSLSSASVRAFRPRDALGPLAPALAFFGLASNTGAWNPAVWLDVAGALTTLAWFSIGEQGRNYALDPSLEGDVHAHRWSGWTMLASGLVLFTGAAGLYWEAIGRGSAGMLVLVALAMTIAAHGVWYREWQQAVRPPANEM